MGVAPLCKAAATGLTSCRCMLDMSNRHRMVELAEADCVIKKAEGFLMDGDPGVMLIRGVEADQRKSRSNFDAPSTGASGSRKCLQQRRLQQLATNGPAGSKTARCPQGDASRRDRLGCSPSRDHPQQRPKARKYGKVAIFNKLRGHVDGGGSRSDSTG